MSVNNVASKLASGVYFPQDKDEIDPTQLMVRGDLSYVAHITSRRTTKGRPMPRYWFTDYDGSDWDPSDGYNEAFTIQIRALRERFLLRKTRTAGIEVGDEWVPYTTPDGVEIMISLPSVEWKRIGFWYGRENVLSPLLKITLRVGELEEPSCSRKCRVNVFWEDEIHITFPESFPTISPRRGDSGKPQIRVPPSYGSTERNILDQGILCIMNNEGDWDPETDTVCRAIEVAAAWATRYFRKR